MSKKVMILTPFYAPTIGGAETFCKLLVSEARKKHTVSVVTCDQSIFKGKPFAGTGIKQFMQVFPELYRKAKASASFTPIIHAQGLIAGLIAVLMKRTYGCKAYVTLLALYDFDAKPVWFRWACRWVLRQADIVFVEGKQGNKDIEPLGIIGVPFTHWVENRFFLPIHKRDDIHVLFIGRDIGIKGKHIIEQAERMLKKKKHIKFAYHSDIPHDKLPAYLALADIVVVPSLYSEGHTRIVCEAAAAGCAVVTSDRGSLPEQVEHFGMNIPPDARPFAWTIEGLDADRRMLKHMQEKAQAYAMKNFTADNAETFTREY